MSLAQRNLKTLITQIFEEEQVEAGEFFAKKMGHFSQNQELRSKYRKENQGEHSALHR